MISKIIQREKERQEEYFNGCGRSTGYPYDEDCGKGRFCELCGGRVQSHKQSLINLKEYMEGELAFFENHVYQDDDPCSFDHHGYCQTHGTVGEDNCSNVVIKEKQDQLKEDIQELNKMIERYE